MSSMWKTRKLELQRQFEFKKYVFSFYGKHKKGLYLQELNLTQKQINDYCDIYIKTFHLFFKSEICNGQISYDSVDRERVRDIIEMDHEE
jgi:hypothetical protein